MRIESASSKSTVSWLLVLCEGIKLLYIVSSHSNRMWGASESSLATWKEDQTRSFHNSLETFLTALSPQMEKPPRVLAVPIRIFPQQSSSLNIATCARWLLRIDCLLDMIVAHVPHCYGPWFLQPVSLVGTDAGAAKLNDGVHKVLH